MDPSLRIHLKQIDGADGQKWDFAAYRKSGTDFTMFPDPRLDWETLKMEDESAELQFTIYDADRNPSRVYAKRPSVEYFQAAGVPRQVIELA